jgi:hypothetical protein
MTFNIVTFVLITFLPKIFGFETFVLMTFVPESLSFEIFVKKHLFQ